jgi:hypothetical protein
VSKLPFNPFRACAHGFHILPTDRINGEPAAISPCCPECCPIAPEGYETQHGDYLRWGYVWQLKAAISKRGHLRDYPDNPLRGEDALDLMLKVRDFVIKTKRATLMQKANATSWRRLGLRGHSGSPSLMDTVFLNAIFDLQGMRDGREYGDPEAHARSKEAGNHQVAINTHTVTPFVEDEEGELESVEEALERVNYKRPRPHYELPAPVGFDEHKLRPGVYMTSPVQYSDSVITVPQYARCDWQREKALSRTEEAFVKANKATSQLWTQEKDYQEKHGQTPAEENLDRYQRGEHWPQSISVEEYFAKIEPAREYESSWKTYLATESIQSLYFWEPRAPLANTIRFDHYEGFTDAPGKIIVPTMSRPQFVRPRDSGSKASQKHRPRFAWYSGQSIHVDVVERLQKVQIINAGWNGYWERTPNAGYGGWSFRRTTPRPCEVRAVSVEATKEVYRNTALPNLKISAQDSITRVAEVRVDLGTTESA